MDHIQSAPITNYKGVMLCNRPNDNIFIPKEKPFCSRVFPHENIGLPLTKDVPEFTHKNTKQTFPALNRHKEWLNEFKLKHAIKKQNVNENKIEDEEKFQRVREMAKKDREVTKKMKEDFNRMSALLQNELKSDTQQQKQKTVPLTEANLKSLGEIKQINEQKLKNQDMKQKVQVIKKPQWALTDQQQEQNKIQEEEDLLNFAQNLNYDQYVDDLEVGIMLKALQQRISELKKEENWKEKEQYKLDKSNDDNITQQAQNNENKVAEDIFDRITQNLNKNDDSKSIASEKTMNSINKLREEQQKQKQGKQDWEKSTSGKQQTITLEDRIAKNVADEILRNYKHLGSVHSNNSIRKILEQEAKKNLAQGSIQGPLISIVKPIDKTRSKIDPNNLPYLHRNPAI